MITRHHYEKYITIVPTISYIASPPIKFYPLREEKTMQMFPTLDATSQLIEFKISQATFQPFSAKNENCRSIQPFLPIHQIHDILCNNQIIL